MFFTHKVPHKNQEIGPADGNWCFNQNVSPSAAAKMDCIRGQALSLGWKEPSLYQNRGRFPFPCGQDYGHVCFVDDEKCIGGVTTRYIESIAPPPRESRQRSFQSRCGSDVDQENRKRNRSKGMTQMALRVGWKEICKLLGCKDIRTARKWARNFSMPLIWVYGRPTILDSHFESWWEKVEKKLMQRRH